MSFRATDGGRRVGMDVCVCVHIHLNKSHACRHTFPRLFSLFGTYTAVLNDWQFVFQNQKLI